MDGSRVALRLTDTVIPPLGFVSTYPASEKCQQEKRKTVNGEDILFAMTSLGFENYAEALKIYLSKYREVSIVWHSYRLSPIFRLSPCPGKDEYLNN
jgi:hypothetical protein